MTHRRAILVSGASSGIGEAIARRFAIRGWDAWAGVRSPRDAERLAGIPQLHPVELDVTSDSSVESCIASVNEARGDRGLDVLVNNAGVAVGGPVEFLPLDEWYQQFEVNLFGVVRLTRAAMPALRFAVDPRIVMIGSISGRLGAPLLGPYVASKHALAGMVSSMRRELDPGGPLVTLVEPGAVRTRIWPKAVQMADRLEATLPAAALERYGDFIAAHRVALRDGDHAGIHPVVVAELVERSVNSARPRARQLVGRDARAGGLLQRFLPDRAMEAVTRTIQRRALAQQRGIGDELAASEDDAASNGPIG